MTLGPTFGEFLQAKVGKNWVIHRRTEHIIRRYGPDVICLSKSRYRELQEQYELETGWSANGLPGEPCERLKKAAPELLAALKHAVECARWCYKHHPDIQKGDGIPAFLFWEDLIARAEGRKS